MGEIVASGVVSGRIGTPRVQPGRLADRLAVARAAERAAGVAVQCGRIGCTGQASSSVRGVALCAGHAGFAAVGTVTA